MTVRSYLEEWLSRYKILVRRSTYEAVEIYVRIHLIPYFPSDLELNKLSSLMCQEYVFYKLSSGRSDGRGGLSLVSVRKHVSVLKQALDDACRLGILNVNPASVVKLPRRSSEPPTREFLTLSEAQNLISAFSSTPWMKLAVVLALYYGLRRSEVLGLKWSAIDFRSDTIYVRHTVVKNTSIVAQDSTKSFNSRRSFKLLPEVKSILLEHYSGASYDGYIITRSDGCFVRPDTFYRSFQRTLARCGLKRMRFQDLRHSTASILFELDWPLEDVKNWLGHADIETTSNIYLHYLASRKRKIAGKLQGLLLT